MDVTFAAKGWLIVAGVCEKANICLKNRHTCTFRHSWKPLQTISRVHQSYGMFRLTLIVLYRVFEHLLVLFSYVASPSLDTSLVSAVSVLWTFAHLRVSVFLGLTASASLLCPLCLRQWVGEGEVACRVCVCVRACVFWWRSFQLADSFVWQMSCRQQHHNVLGGQGAAARGVAGACSGRSDAERGSLTGFTTPGL